MFYRCFNNAHVQASGNSVQLNLISQCQLLRLNFKTLKNINKKTHHEGATNQVQHISKLILLLIMRIQRQTSSKPHQTTKPAHQLTEFIWTLLVVTNQKLMIFQSKLVKDKFKLLLFFTFYFSINRSQCPNF